MVLLARLVLVQRGTVLVKAQKGKLEAFAALNGVGD